MGARPHARPVAAAPIDQVVPGFRARLRVVRDLVGAQPCFLAHALRNFIHIGGGVFIRQAPERPLGKAVAEGRTGLDRQLVERQVIGGHCQRLGQFRAPLVRCLVLTRIDQVEARARERLACDIEGVAGLRDRMKPTKAAQIGVVQRLDTHGNAVDAGVAEFPEPAGLDGGGVGLQRDLDIVGKGPALPRGVEDGRDDLGLHQGGRSPTEEDAAQEARARFLRNTFYFRNISRKPPVVVDPRRDMGVEVAIGAFRLTERPVDIKPEIPRACRVRQDQRSSPAWRRRRRGG